jgi:small Trp-rich protein
MLFMRVPGDAAKRRSATIRITASGSRRLTPGALREARPPGRNLMLFVLIGVALIALNLAGIGTFGTWNWQVFGDLWKFVLPFAIAALWWVWSDKSGLNKRREMERMDKKKSDRRKENLAALGMDTRARRKAQKQQR